MKCVFWFSIQLLSEIFLIVRIYSKMRLKMYIGLHVKYTLFVSDFKETWILPKDFRKNPSIKFSWKSVQYGSTDGQAWRSQKSPFASLRTRLQTTDRTARLTDIRYEVWAFRQSTEGRSVRWALTTARQSQAFGHVSTSRISYSTDKTLNIAKNLNCPRW